MFWKIAVHSSSVCSRVCPSYLNCSTPSTNSSPSPSHMLNSISPDLCYSSNSLHCRHISVSLSNLSICMFRPNLAAGMCILHWSHCGIGVRTSCRISILDFQCLYMNFSLSLHGLCVLAVHPSTGNTTDVNTCGKDTTYVSDPPPPMFTLRVCVMTLL